MSTLREQFALLSAFLRTGFRKTVLLCSAGFLIAGFLGCVAGHLSPEIITEMLNSFAQVVEDAGVVNEDGTFSPFALLANNWSAMLISALYGFFPFLFFPAVSLFSNGFLMGVMAAMYQINGISMTVFFAALIPHGIFELPALVLSIACGIYLCLQVNRAILRSPNRPPLLETFCDLLRVMLLLVAPMTIIAAFVEAYVTPIVMSFFI